MKDDQTLIDRFLLGDQRAFDQLVLKHQEMVRQFMYRATTDVDDTNDLAQEAFIKVYHNLHRFRRQSEFSTWLYRIASNVLSSYFRRRRFRQWLPMDDQLPEAPAPDPADAADLRRELMVQLPRLPARERQVVILRGLQELPVADTARILGTSENVVKVAYHSARKKLKGRMRND